MSTLVTCGLLTRGWEKMGESQHVPTEVTPSSMLSPA